MKNIMKDLPALFCSLAPEGSFPGDPIDQLIEEPALYFPGIHLHLPITTSRFSLPLSPLPHPSPYKLLFSICIFVFHGTAHSCGRTGMWVPAPSSAHPLAQSQCNFHSSLASSRWGPGACLALGSNEAKPHKRCLFCSIL